MSPGASELTQASASPLPPEEQARADLYALLARLFYAPPDRGLLDLLAASRDLEAATPDSGLAMGWRALKQAAATDVDAVREEFEALFGGTGKAAVTLYASAYVDWRGGENPLVELREFMAQQGFARRTNAFEPEDHVAALCDMMRHLIIQQRGIGAERRLFDSFIWQSIGPLCGAISESPGSKFYRSVAAVAQAYCEIEHAAFEIE